MIHDVLNLRQVLISHSFIKKPICQVRDLDDVTSAARLSLLRRIRGFPPPSYEGFGLLLRAQFPFFGIATPFRFLAFIDGTITAFFIVNE